MHDVIQFSIAYSSTEVKTWQHELATMLVKEREGKCERKGKRKRKKKEGKSVKEKLYKQVNIKLDLDRNSVESILN